MYIFGKLYLRNKSFFFFLKVLGRHLLQLFLSANDPGLLASFR